MPNEPIKVVESIVDNSYQTPTETPVETPATPAIETPTTPVIETPATPATETPVTVVPFEERWRQEFGEVDLSTVKQRFSQFDIINSEYEKLKNVPTYKTDAGKQIDEWLSKGVKLETITRFQNIKAEQLSDEDAIKLRAEIENPAWQKKHIDADYQSKYAFVKDELKSDEENETQEALKEASRLRDAASARAHLAEYLGKQFNPSVELGAEQKTEAQKQLASSWPVYAPTLQNGFKELKGEHAFKVPTEKGEEEVKLAYSYQIPENDLKRLTEYAINTAVQQGVQPTDEGIKNVQAFVQKTIWAEYGDKITRSAINDALSQQARAFEKLINNPAVTSRSTNVGGGGMDFNQAVLQAEINARGRG